MTAIRFSAPRGFNIFSPRDLVTLNCGEALDITTSWVVWDQFKMTGTRSSRSGGCLKIWLRCRRGLCTRFSVRGTRHRCRYWRRTRRLVQKRRRAASGGNKGSCLKRTPQVLLAGLSPADCLRRVPRVSSLHANWSKDEYRWRDYWSQARWLRSSEGRQRGSSLWCNWVIWRNWCG